MIEMLSIGMGAGAGCVLAFVPGLHVALALTLLLASGLLGFLGPAGAGCFVAAAAGSVLYSKRLGAVYHPSAGSEDAASMDPALRLTQAGKGADCLRIMVFATDVSWLPIIGLAVVLGLLAVNGVDGAKMTDSALGLITVPVVLIWMVWVIFKSRHKLTTLMGLLMTGLVGYCVLHHPALVGNEHQLAPLMSGLFAIPIMWLVFKERQKVDPVTGLRLKCELPAQHPYSGKLEGDPGMALVGAVIGAFSGFFAGLGAGSLLGMASPLCRGDEDYLLLSAAGEAANDSLALLLVLVAGIGRSGEAILLGRATGHLTIGPGLIMFLAVGVGAFIGRKFVYWAESHYLVFLKMMPPSFWAGVVVVLALWQVIATGQLVVSLALMVAAAGIAFWSRMNHLPLQVAFGSLALPLVVSKLGLVVLVNGLLFS